MIEHLTIPLLLKDGEIELYLADESGKQTLVYRDDANENGEAPFQIKEGCSYEYKISKGYTLVPSEIVTRSKVSESSGRIIPNTYVGTLEIDILNKFNIKCGVITLEVQSQK